MQLWELLSGMKLTHLALELCVLLLYKTVDNKS